MNQNDQSNEARRSFLKLAGGTAVLLPLAALTACAKQEAPAPAPAAAAPPSAAEPQAAAPAEPAAAPTPAADLPELQETDPVAAALGYKHDAAQVDKAKYSAYVDGHNCANCLQWKGTDADAWAACGLFPGKKVNAKGWCMSYVPKA